MITANTNIYNNKENMHEGRTFEQVSQDYLTNARGRIASTTYDRYLDALERDIYPEYANSVDGEERTNISWDKREYEELSDEEFGLMDVRTLEKRLDRTVSALGIDDISFERLRKTYVNGNSKKLITE